MYSPKYFKVQELVPQSVYDQRKERAIELLDERVLITLDQLREFFGICTINNWSLGGNFSQSGLRTSDAKEYSPTSQHSFGRAMDCKFRDHKAEEVRQHILNNRLMFPYITFIEDEVSWLHFDVRNCKRITLWSPKTKKIKII